MKTKHILMGFLLLTAFAFMVPVKAADYEMGVEEDQELIWSLNSLDEDAMADIWGDDWDEDDFWDDAEVGAKMKMEITKIEDGEPYYGDIFGGEDSFKVTFDFWYFDDVDGDNFGDEDVEDSTRTMYEDPDNYGDDMTVSRYSFLFPVNTEEYFDEMDWHKDTDREGLKFTIEHDEGDSVWGGIADEDITIEITYNTNGVLQNAKLFDKDDNIVAEFSLGSIPGYELPILLGITAIFSIGIIYVMKKKMK